MPGLTLLLAVLGSVAFPQQAPLSPPSPPAAARILVLPFENTQRETRLTWLGEASAMLLTDELNARGLAAITRDERVRAFEQLHLPVAASLSRATVIKVGQLLGASEVIAGAFRMSGDELVVEAHSIRIEAGRLEQPVTERAPLKDFFAIYDRLARRVSAGAARTRPAIPPAPPGAFESYIKGLLAESAATQATFLESAIAEFPGVRSGAARALGRQERAGRSRRRAGRGQAGPPDLSLRRARAAPHRALAARVQGLSGRRCGVHAAARSADPENHRAGPGASRAGPERPRDRAAAARRQRRRGLGGVLPDPGCGRAIPSRWTTSSISATPI